MRPNETKNISQISLDEPSLLTKNNIFTILTSLRKSQGSSQSKVQAKNMLHEVHHLRNAQNCYMTCISLLKKTLESKFKVILNQIRKYNQEALIKAYKTQLSKTIHTLLSCYENMAFVTILSQNFYGVKKWTKEGLSFLANVEKGYLGFYEPKNKRIKIDLKKSFSDNFKKGSVVAGK